MAGDLEEAVAGQAVTLTLTDEIDISRGDLLTATDAPPLHTRHPETHLVWLHDEPLQPGQLYLVKTASAVTPGRVTSVQYGVDVNSLEQTQVPTLGLNGIGVVRLELDRPVSFDPYRQNRATGSFILIDRYTNATVAAGMVISAPVDADAAEVIEFIPGTIECEDAAERVVLSEAAVSATGGSVVDLTGNGCALEFETCPSFIDHVGRGNRVLFRLRDLAQLPAVALLAFEHRLSFEFDRTAEGISILLFRRGIRPSGAVYADDGMGI